MVFASAVSLRSSQYIQAIKLHQYWGSSERCPGYLKFPPIEKVVYSASIFEPEVECI